MIVETSFTRFFLHSDCISHFRWSELTRKLEFHVEVQELNESGTYVPVEVQPRPGIGTGGIFQLRQGQQRRIKAFVRYAGKVHFQHYFNIILYYTENISDQSRTLECCQSFASRLFPSLLGVRL